MRQRSRVFVRAGTARALLVLAVLACGSAQAEDKVLPSTQVENAAGSADSAALDFNSDRWSRSDATVSDYLGRPALAGTALLKDAQFDNGVIEVDIAVTGARSYPGILFRVQSRENCERFYIRPHRSALYADVLQYLPVFNGLDSWQLYSGNGFTAGATIPTGQWVHVRLEVSGTQARVFLGDGTEPALVIPDLKHGVSRGTIGLDGPKDGSAYFSNFSYRSDAGLPFGRPSPSACPPGVITEWQLSPPYKARQVEREQPLQSPGLSDIAWKKVSSDSSGLVDISRHYGRLGNEPDCILARAVISSVAEEVRQCRFGYSDEVTILLNGMPVFYGDSRYRSRDSSFLGVAGLFDAVYLPLRRGDNELLLVVTENFGGWGFMFQDATAVYQAPGVTRLWQTAKDLHIPESAAYDAARNAIYVSNYDGYNPSGSEGRQSVSRLSAEGKMEAPQWVNGLRNPTGLAVLGDTLFVVEPTSLVEIDIPAAEIKQRHAVPGAMALNDVAVDSQGVLYLSDSARNILFRLADGECREWAKGPEIRRPNGVWVRGTDLLFCNNGDNGLKSIALATGEIKTLANFGPGILDGLAADAAGNILVSHNDGRLYRVTPAGDVTKLLDTSVPGISIADFAYVPERHLIVAPSWTDNRVLAYQVHL
jgi:sugar lactone lactonase YvrE